MLIELVYVISWVLLGAFGALGALSVGSFFPGNPKLGRIIGVSLFLVAGFITALRLQS